MLYVYTNLIENSHNVVSVFILHHDKHRMCLENIEIHTEDLKLGGNP